MKQLSRLSVMAATLAAACYLGGVLPAASQTSASTGQVAAVKNTASAAAAKKKPAPKEAAPKVRSGTHVYLLRGLLNVFSLGMDDLAEKLTRRGVYATVHNHAEWQSLSDQIAAQYKAGNRSAVVLVGHSLGADAVMLMGAYLGERGVPVSLIVPFDGTASFPATRNVRAVMNLTQRDYARMTRGPGFGGNLQNIDVSSDQSIGHISIDKSARLHAMVVNRILGIGGHGGSASAPAAPKPAQSTSTPASPDAKKSETPSPVSAASSSKSTGAAAPVSAASSSKATSTAAPAN